MCVNKARGHNAAVYIYVLRIGVLKICTECNDFSVFKSNIAREFIADDRYDFSVFQYFHFLTSKITMFSWFPLLNLTHLLL